MMREARESKLLYLQNYSLLRRLKDGIKNAFISKNSHTDTVRVRFSSFFFQHHISYLKGLDSSDGLYSVRFDS